MLRSSNPVLTHTPAFSGQRQQSGQAQYGQDPFNQTGPYAQTGTYGQTGAPGTQAYPGGPGGPGGPQAPFGQPTTRSESPMTLDDVITKTALTILGVVLAAAASWWAVLVGIIPAGLLMPVGIGAALLAFVAVLVATMRRRVSPGLVMAAALIEGVFVGIFSLIFESMYQGIVAQAVLATFVTAGVTLGAYKVLNIRVTKKFHKIVGIATAAYALTLLINLAFAVFGVDLGIRSFGNFSALSLLISAIGVTLAVLNLVRDFDYVEQGIRAGAPTRESWRAALGLTVTLVWLYVEILRILSYFRR
jgi:uncharacterized YccA/Bax inhibitor family protein